MRRIMRYTKWSISRVVNPLAVVHEVFSYFTPRLPPFKGLLHGGGVRNILAPELPLELGKQF
jgi:hypothetical protein